MKPEYHEIDDLVKWYLDGTLLLPEMQRKYVWTSSKVRNLVDSVYRDYPSGSILLWRAEKAPETRTSAMESATEIPRSPLTQKLYLLDGQQRITSLATVMTGRPIRIKEGDNIVERHVDVYFNLDHPESLEIETNSAAGLAEDIDFINENSRNKFFQVFNKAIENQPNWVSVTRLFSGGPHAILKDLRISYDDPLYEKYFSRLNTLYSQRKNYVYPVQILPETFSYAQATDVFIRVNSAGTTLSGPDLALALVTSRWPGSMKLFDEFVAECFNSNFDLDAGFLIRCVMAQATGQSRFDRIGKIPMDDIKTGWEKTKPGLQFAINFVKNNAKVQTSSIIPSLYALIPLSVHAVRSNYNFGNEEHALLRWFYAASMWGRYSRGSSEAILDEDLAALKSDHPGDELIKNLTRRVGRTEVSDEDVKGASRNSPFFMMMYVLALRNSAKDWGTGLEFSLTSLGKGHRIQIDHIFPRARMTKLLRESYPELERKVIRTRVNDIANLAFLSQRENPRKSDRLPNQYLGKIRKERGDEALTAQYVPLDKNLWETDRYDEFLSARRRLIVDAINSLIRGLAGTAATQTRPDVPSLIANGENQSVEFKSSMRWDYKNGSANGALGYVVVKAIASFLNSFGGTLLIGVDDNKNILGLDKDFQSFGPGKQNEDGFALHFVQLVKNYLGIEQMQYVRLSFEGVQGHQIAVITISRAPQPVFLRANNRVEFYVKAGNSSQPLDNEETLRYVPSHWGSIPTMAIPSISTDDSSLDTFVSQPEEGQPAASSSDSAPAGPAKDSDAPTSSQVDVPRVSRTSLLDRPDGETIICPARPDGIDFLLKYNAWGFVGVKRVPRYFVLYVTNPLGYTKYFAEVERLLDPADPSSPVKNYRAFVSYSEGKKIIRLRRGSLRELSDGVRLGEKRGLSQSFWYTTLRKFVSARTLDDTA